MYLFNFDDNIGLETLNNEFKEFTFNNSGIILDLKDAEYYCSTNLFKFNSYVIDNIKKYFEYFMIKCLCAFINANIEGNFYIGINDVGFVKGIPYKGNLPKNEIKTIIIELLTKYVHIDNQIIDWNNILQIFIEEISPPKKPMTNINPNYTKYLKLKEKYMKQYNSYQNAINSWHIKHSSVTQKLVNLVNIPESRLKLIEYIKKTDPNSKVIDLLKTNYKLEYKNHDEIFELKQNEKTPYYWVTKWKDELSTKIRKEKPLFNKNIMFKTIPINLIISVNNMIPYWYHNNENIKLYVIHIKINKINSANICKYYDIIGSKWISCIRILDCKGSPICQKQDLI